MSHKVFAERLERLEARLLEMSHSVQSIVESAVHFALTSEGSVDEIRDLDSEIDREEVAIEEACIELLALHQPMASDLRLLVTILKSNSDLERIGDHAVNIAEAAGRLQQSTQPPAMPPEIPEMSRIALEMLRDALDALVHRNSQEAQAVRARDDRVDALHESLFRVMLTHMLESNISACLQVILISRNLERIADLATNIGEDVVFMVRGITVRHRIGPQEG
ncbi:MAG: phosphate signaling complex protein PhoU [Gemmatimonadota bacterium]|nr:phosphate signaling complex protein PhoU [Gemmatimonadota bacterium]